MSSSPAWVSAWLDAWGISAGLPEWVSASISVAALFLLILVPSATLISYLDRKLSADFQARVGPNRAGPAGLFQPLADLLKLLQKETRREWSWKENLWLIIHTMALYSTLAVIPLGSLALMVDTEMSAFLPFWSALVLALGTMLLGLGQGSVPGWFGGIRVAAQTLAGCFPALIALLCAGMRTGSFRWSVLASSQGFMPWQWTCFSNPFQLIALMVFVMSGLVLLEISPLDGGHSMSDIHGGVASHLYGRRFSLFNFGRFYGFFFWSVITVVLFLGAWNLPYHLVERLKDWGAVRLLGILELLLILTKTFFVMLLVVWVARVSPRSRVDQITDFAWKVLSPFSLVALVGASIWAGWRAFQ